MSCEKFLIVEQLGETSELLNEKLLKHISLCQKCHDIYLKNINENNRLKKFIMTFEETIN